MTKKNQTDQEKLDAEVEKAKEQAGEREQNPPRTSPGSQEHTEAEERDAAQDEANRAGRESALDSGHGETNVSEADRETKLDARDPREQKADMPTEDDRVAALRGERPEGYVTEADIVNQPRPTQAVPRPEADPAMVDARPDDEKDLRGRIPVSEFRDTVYGGIPTSPLNKTAVESLPSRFIVFGNGVPVQVTPEDEEAKLAHPTPRTFDRRPLLFAHEGTPIARMMAEGDVDGLANQLAVAITLLTAITNEDGGNRRITGADINRIPAGGRVTLPSALPEPDGEVMLSVQYLNRNAVQSGPAGGEYAASTFDVGHQVTRVG